jgi:hypothetical protein
MKNKFLKFTLVGIVVAFSNLANAGLIYDVNLDHGTGSVFGTIETDGTIGDIALSNIVSINLSLQSTNINNNLLFDFDRLASDGSMFKASQNELTFDFNGSSNGGYTIFWFASGFDSGYWCLNGTPAICDGNNGASSLGFKTDPLLDVLTGISTIASRDVQVDVPEPSTLAIFGLGLMGLASRRFKKQS